MDRQRQPHSSMGTLERNGRKKPPLPPISIKLFLLRGLCFYPLHSPLHPSTLHPLPTVWHPVTKPPAFQTLPPSHLPHWASGRKKLVTAPEAQWLLQFRACLLFPPPMPLGNLLPWVICAPPHCSQGAFMAQLPLFSLPGKCPHLPSTPEPISASGHA